MRFDKKDYLHSAVARYDFVESWSLPGIPVTSNVRLS